MSAAVKWIKIVTDIFSDEKIQLIEQLPDGDGIIVCWFKLLCLAGRSNSSGVLMMTDRVPYTDDMLSVIFRRPIAMVRNALQVFVQFGMIEVIGNTITIPNWELHQSIEANDKYREQTKKRVAEYRARQQLLVSGDTEQHEITQDDTNSNVTGNVTVTPGNALDVDVDVDIDTISFLPNDDTPISKPSPIPKKIQVLLDRFNVLWANYPRKDGKANAFKAYEKAVKEGVTDEQIADGISRYADFITATDKEAQFVKMGSTWFNQKGWEDEYKIAHRRTSTDDIKRIY